jgi:hypothetical protein
VIISLQHFLRYHFRPPIPPIQGEKRQFVTHQVAMWEVEVRCRSLKRRRATTQREKEPERAFFSFVPATGD